MIELGISKIALIGAVALIVIGPDKLPRVARMVGTMLGRAQRYVADVKAEVNRSMDLDELKKMKETVESAARDVQGSIQTTANDFEKSWNEVTGEAQNALSGVDSSSSSYTYYPEYRHPQKKWRTKTGAVPSWYKARAGIRTKALSGAARVARYRPTSKPGTGISA
jgi:sec-independent protein translocase protein TatB